jgi:type IV fimbrial biogenesis protein FimT
MFKSILTGYIDMALSRAEYDKLEDGTFDPGRWPEKFNISKMEMDRTAGFTLMEMIVVVAVFSILAAIAIPSFMSLLPGMRLNGAARQVLGDLMAARMKAVKLNQRTKVFFDNRYQYRICDDADNNDTVTSGEGDVEDKSIQANYQDVSFDLNNTSDPVFFPKGTATNRTITLRNSSGSKSITVSIAGRVKIN